MQKLEETERDIMNAIITYLNYTGKYYAWRTNSGSIKLDNRDGSTRMIRMARAGTSDIFAIRRGDAKFIAIEVKRPGKKPTPAQEEFINMIREYGGIAGIATSIEEAEAILK